MTKINRKTLIGEDVSDKCDTTRDVLVKRASMHPLYKKKIIKKIKIMIHDKDNKSKHGDNVKIVECRPISKRKKWALLDILKKA